MQFHLAEFGQLAQFQEWSPGQGNYAPKGKAFLCAGPSSPFRKRCSYVISHPVMRAVWYCLVALSTLLAMAIQPRYAFPAPVEITLFAIQCVCLVFFWVRMVIEIGARGLLLNDRAFLRSFWNVVELAVNVFGILQVIPPTFHIRWMRAFAALRPVRFLLIVPGFRALVIPLGRSFPYFFDVVLAFVVASFCLSLLGLFSTDDGMTRHRLWPSADSPVNVSALHPPLPCRPQNISSKFDVGTRGSPMHSCWTNAPQLSVAETSPLTDPSDSPLETVRDRYYHFKNIGTSLLVTLQVAMVDNWYQPLEAIMNVLGAGASLLPVTVVVTTFAVYAAAHAVVSAAFALWQQQQQQQTERRSASGSEGSGHVKGETRAALGHQGEGPNGGPQRCTTPSHTNVLSRMDDSSPRRCSSDFHRASEDLLSAGQQQKLRPHSQSTRLPAEASSLSSEESERKSWLSVGEDTDDTIAGTMRVLAKKRLRDASVQTVDPPEPKFQSTTPPQPSSPDPTWGGRNTPTTGLSMSRLGNRLDTPEIHRHETIPEDELPTRLGTVADTPPPRIDLPEWVHGASRHRRYRGFVPLAEAIRFKGFTRAISSLETTTRVNEREYDKMGKLRLTLAKALTSMALSLFLEGLALANVVVLAVVYTGMPLDSAKDLCDASAAMAIFFFMVLLLRAIAFGPGPVARDGWNYVDMAGGVGGILEFAISNVLLTYPVAAGLLRACRVLHAIKYVIPSRVLRANMWELSHWGFLCVSVVALYALLGMQLFADSYTPVQSTSLVIAQSALVGDFTTIWNALLVMFTSLTLSNISTRMTHVFVGGTIPTGVLFFFSYGFIVSFLLEPLLLSVLIHAFKHTSRLVSADDSDEVDDGPPPLLLEELPLPQLSPEVSSGDEEAPLLSAYSKLEDNDSRVADVLRALNPNSSVSPVSACHSGGAPRHPVKWHAATLVEARTGTNTPSARVAADRCESTRVPLLSALLAARCQSPSWREALAQQHLVSHGATGFYLLRFDHPVRHVLTRMFASAVYRVISSLVVLLGLVALFFEQRRPSLRREEALHKANIAFVVFFWVEMALKWMTFGMLGFEVSAGPRLLPAEKPSVLRHARERVAIGEEAKQRVVRPYFRAPINWFDAAANGLTFAGVFYPPLRVGRVLQTARLFTTQEMPNPRMRMVLRALMASCQRIPFVVMAYCFFAVLGLHLFAGRMHACVDPTTDLQDSRQRAFTIPLTSASPHVLPNTSDSGNVSCVWEPLAFRYDHFGHALLSVLVVTTTNNWTTLLTTAMSVPSSETSASAVVSAPFRALDTHRALQPLHSGYYVLYFVATVLLVRLFALKTLPASMAASFSRLRCDFEGLRGGRDGESEVCGGSLLNPDSIFRVTGVTGEVEPLPNRFSRLLHAKILSYRLRGRGKPLVSYVIGSFVVVHSAIMASRHVAALQRVVTMCDAFDYAAIGVYGGEFLLSLFSYGWRPFLRRSRAIMDAAILSLLVVAVARPSLSFFRAFAILKLVWLTGADLTLHLCCHRWPYVANAVAVFFFVLMSYALVGTLLFGDASLGVQGSSNGSQQGLLHQRNFDTVIDSLLVLFDCSTGDNWHLVMLDCAHRTDYGGHVAVVFFVSFTVLTRILCIPLILAVTVEAFVPCTSWALLEHFVVARRLWRKHFGGSLHDVGASQLLAVLPEFPSALTGIAAARAPWSRAKLSGGETAGKRTRDRFSADASVEVLSFLLRSTLEFHQPQRALGSEEAQQFTVSYEAFIRSLLHELSHGCPATLDRAELLLENGQPSRAVATPTFAFSSVVRQYAKAVEQQFWAKPEAEHIPVPPRSPFDERVCFTSVASPLVVQPDERQDNEDDEGGLLQVRNADVTIPTGTLAVPGSNLFLFHFLDDDGNHGELYEDDSSSEEAESVAPLSHSDSM